MAMEKLGYWRRLWNALTGTPNPPFIFGLEDADKLLSAPGVADFEGGDGAVPVAIVATARFLGAVVTVAEEAAAHIDLNAEEIEQVQSLNQEQQEALNAQIEALEAAKVVAQEEAQQAVAACEAEMKRADRVKSFFARAL